MNRPGEKLFQVLPLVSGLVVVALGGLVARRRR